MKLMRLWVGVDPQGNLYVYDHFALTDDSKDEVWLFRVGDDSGWWVKVNRVEHRALLRTSKNPEEKEKATRAYVQHKRENRMPAKPPAASDVLDMRWAGGSSGDGNQRHRRRRYL